MTADYEKDEIIEELRTGLREQESMLAVQTERITLLEGERRSPRTARPKVDDVPERRPRRLTRGGMLKAAAMGAIGLAGAEAASSLGAERAFAAASTADNYTAAGSGYPTAAGFESSSTGQFNYGGYFVGKSGIYAEGQTFDGVIASSQSGHAVSGYVNSLANAGDSVILAEVDSLTRVANDAAALRGKIDSTGGNGIAVYGSHAGDGPGVVGDSAGYGFGILGSSGHSNGVFGRSFAPTGTAPSVAAGVLGASDSGPGVHGVAGYSSSNGGYGGKFEILRGGLAQLLLTPFGSGGYPTTGAHQTGEIFMDPNGNLFVCVASGTPGAWKQVAYSGTGPTDARLRHFTIVRHGDRVDFHWHMADGKGVAGFELYAAGRRLNRETIRPHRAKTYDVSATWKGNGPFALHVLLSDGNVISVQPE